MFNRELSVPIEKEGVYTAMRNCLVSIYLPLARSHLYFALLSLTYVRTPICVMLLLPAKMHHKHASVSVRAFSHSGHLLWSLDQPDLTWLDPSCSQTLYKGRKCDQAFLVPSTTHRVQLINSDNKTY